MNKENHTETSTKMVNEKEKMEKLAELLRFIDLMVRQTCLRAHLDNQTRVKDKDSLYSNDHLRKVYERPREYVYQLVKNPSKSLKGLRVENSGPLPKKDNKFTEIEQKILLDFVRKVQVQSPKAHFVWIDLQHYLFYAYRNFNCKAPKATGDNLSAFFVCEMRELINCLRKEDESQLWLRVCALLREYCIFAQWNYSRNDGEEPLKKFLIYYEAMLTAAKSLIPVFAEFEKGVIFKKYRVCWIDLNTYIFIKFFYENDRVTFIIQECLRTKKSPGDSPQTFAAVNKLIRMWSAHQKWITLVNNDAKWPDNTPGSMKSKKIWAAVRKMLIGNFWIDRSKELKKLIDPDRLNDIIFELLKDKLIFPDGPGLNKHGQCICEECLIAKYKTFLDLRGDLSPIASVERTAYCRKCKAVIVLEQFQRHINTHIEDISGHKETPKPSLTRIISEKMDFVKLGDNTVQLSEMLNEKLKICGDVVNNLDKATIKQDMASTKIAFEQFLQMRKDPKNTEHLKNGRVASLRDELIANGFGKPIKDDPDEMISPNVTAEKLAETELMLREFTRKITHKPSVDSTDDPTWLICPIPPEDLNQTNKCDCTYCEIFSGPKIIESRDKLRVRLYRRREKRRQNENPEKFSDYDLSKNKVESRVKVPLPPSPSNLPSTPPEVDHSVSVGKMNEIRGLINYIEGNPAKAKADLAQKKAAKKARQREKKEQEKLQAELEIQRRLEEEIRQEEERRKELEREKERLEEQKRLDEAKLKKKMKKQRQAQKRQELAVQKNTIEETIPAMVTIKRVPGGENGTPSVTITLKGCTPDQDKLLTTLVEDPKMEVKPQQLKSVIDAKVSSKKKKNGALKDVPVPTQVQQLTKEPKIISKDVKVTLAVDKNHVTVVQNTLDFVAEKQPSKKKVKEVVKREREPTDDEFRALGNLRLPPGITITKIEGPITNKTYLGTDSNKNSSVLGKSGVIVVDTEKLIQKSEGDGLKPPMKVGKKKKKKNKKAIEAQAANSDSKDKPKMVTLRNPMFQQFQNQTISSSSSNKPPIPVADESAPAAIFTSENGMVTIRSSRLQQSLDNGMGKSLHAAPLGMPLIPDLLSEVSNFPNPNHYKPDKTVNGIEKSKETVEKKNATTLNAQEILSGLPGIEITKIDKRNDKNEEMDIDSSCLDAQVSIIPSNGNEFDLEFDKDDDWLFDSVFKPRDVLEDDMDDEELELEAFKRFCQQSVPPKEKKVAHFNVADIVLKKKLT